ncbi:hypothetical protein B0H16DRAFT_1747515 [Mycena metata]|uniref:Uncharacterized protein n=1 Tax=Mycena metata TaxID=1033252 RepID=A0AAD7GT19_9AGAR|nr:hypothetical protein B0H16DRAFT_1747515 [Mycena metata]
MALSTAFMTLTLTLTLTLYAVTLSLTLTLTLNADAALPTKSHKDSIAYIVLSQRDRLAVQAKALNIELKTKSN